MGDKLFTFLFKEYITEVTALFIGMCLKEQLYLKAVVLLVTYISPFYRYYIP